ncbi:MAG: alpha,2-mannosyltransferase [Pseudonocardiales bacterium]|nr:alpha,2-mannosyltransferase [Pseudonocardiales bacterium]
MATTQDHRRTVWRPLAVAVAAVLVLAQGAVLAIWPAAHTLMIDLQVYRAGGEAVLRGAPLYDGGVLLDLPFVYPPFAALVFVPLTVLPLTILKIAWTVAGVASLVFVVRRSAAMLGRRLDPVVTALLVAVVLALDPVRTTFYLGQINVVLLALVLADLTGRPESRLRGVGVGIAAALKLTPLLFVAYLLLTGRRRAAATAVATFAAAVGLGFLLDPADSTVYWLRGTFAAADRISPVAATANHSLAGLLARADVPRAGALVAMAVRGVAGLVVAVRAHRRGDELLALTLCGLLAAADAPFAWSHHFVWFAPLVVLLAHHAVAGDRRAQVALAGLLVVTLAWITRLPGPGVGPIPSTGLISLLPDAYLVAVVVVTAGAAPTRREP